ncbi:MAG: hypothetical protein ACHP84_16630 [Caulobacterales bacterium]
MSGQVLFWLGMVFGFGGIVAYFSVLTFGPQASRLVNGAGLFLTGLGLIQTAFVVRLASPSHAWLNANLAIVALCLAVFAQTLAIVRNRKAWDGVDRRSGEPAAT